jgi:hypothetical protein
MHCVGYRTIIKRPFTSGTVNLRGSLFTAITPGDVEGMGAAGKLLLGGSLQLRELPDAPAAWHTLEQLEVVNTLVSERACRAFEQRARVLVFDSPTCHD